VAEIRVRIVIIKGNFKWLFIYIVITGV